MIAALSNSPAIWFIVAAFALSIGSFLAVVIYRLPLMLERRWSDEDAADQSTLSLYSPPSHCHACQRRLRWWHNIPLFSFILLKGSCAYCKTPIARHHFYVELITLVLWLWFLHVYGLSFAFAGAVLASSLLTALAFIDWQKRILPDELNLSLLWLGLLINSFGVFTTLKDAVYGAIAGYVTFWLIQNIFALLRNRRGLGQGDLKLFAAIGAWLGWQALPGVVLLASLLGVVVSYSLLRYNRQSLGQEVAFGPYLSIGAIIGLSFYGFILDPVGSVIGTR